MAAEQRSNTKSGRGRGKKSHYALALVGFLVVCIWVSAVLAAQDSAFGLVRGVRLEGAALSSDTPQAQSEIRNIIKEYETAEFQLTLGGEVIEKTTLQALGGSLSVDTVLDKINQATDQGGTGGQFIAQIQSFFGWYNVELSEELPADKLDTLVSKINKKVHLAPQNASFSWKNKELVIAREKAGVRVDKEALKRRIERINPKKISSLEIPIELLPASLTHEMLQPLKEQISLVAGEPLRVIAGDQQITLTTEQLVSVFDLRLRSSLVEVQLNDERIRSLLNDVIAKAEVSAQPTLVGAGVTLQQGVAGYSIDATEALNQIKKVLTERHGGKKAALVTLRGKEIAPPTKQVAAINNSTGAGSVRLTFDDGPGYYTDHVLDILSRYNVHATFYVLGSSAERFSEQMRRIAAEGHVIGNHSYNHANLTLLSYDEVSADITRTQDIIKRIVGSVPTAFRPPYGAVNDTVREVTALHGLSIDLWSVDPQDWAEPGAGVIVERVLGDVQPGSVVLLHVTKGQTVEALPSIIEGIRNLGYTFE